MINRVGVLTAKGRIYLPKADDSLSSLVRSEGFIKRHTVEDDQSKNPLNFYASRLLKLKIASKLLRGMWL
jgi:hypothetical protein